MEAFEKIREIQKNAILEFGDPRMFEPSISEFIKSKKHDCESGRKNPFTKNSLESLNEIERLYSLGKISSHQSMNELLIYYNCWNYIRSVDINLTSSYPKPTKIDEFYSLGEKLDNSEVMLATAFTGNMNGRSINGENNSRGILFESDLTVWSSVLALFIIKLTFKEELNTIKFRSLDFDYSLKEQKADIQSLVRFIANTVISGSCSIAAAQVDISLPKETEHLIVCFQNGFNLFCVGHEHSHLTRKHSIRARDRDGPIAYPSDLPQAIQLIDLKYQNRSFNISQKRSISKIKMQSLELEADLYGMCYAFDSFSSLPNPRLTLDFVPPQEKMGDVNTDAIFYGQGLASVLWSLEIVERMAGILTFGRKYIENDLISVDFSAQNLLLRHIHPCPIYRMNQLIMWSSKYEGASNTISPFYLKLIKYLDSVFIQLYDSGKTAHPKWTQENTELHDQFSLF